MNFESIIQLEKLLLDSSVRKNPVELDRLLAEDFIEFGTSGKVYNKMNIIELLPKEDSATIEAFDFRAIALSSEFVQLTFKTNRQNKDGSITSSLRCSIWKKNGNQWQMFFHQGTKTVLG